MLEKKNTLERHFKYRVLASNCLLKDLTNRICAEKPSSRLDRRASDPSLEPVVREASPAPLKLSKVDFSLTDPKTQLNC